MATGLQEGKLWIQTNCTQLNIAHILTMQRGWVNTKMYIYISNIQSVSEDSGCRLFLYKIYEEHCWRSRDKLISDVLQWTPTYGQAKAGRPAWTYIQQLCEDTECSPEDLPEAMNDREKWRERVRDIRAGSTTWWWWCLMYGYCYITYSLQVNNKIHIQSVYSAIRR